MQPLKLRERPTSPIEADGIELLRSTETYQPPPGLKQRVRMKLLAVPVASPRFRFRRSFGVGVVIAAAAASAAWGGRTYLGYGSAGRTKPTVVDPPSDAPGVVTRSAKQPVTGKDDEVASPSELPAADGAPPALNRLRSPTTTKPPSPATDKSLVFDAMRALRREGEPERAARLLDDYLRKYPGGSMCEEALALAVEAHQVLGDGRAASYANRYLAKYPEGRFSASALRARTQAGE